MLKFISIASLPIIVTYVFWRTYTEKAIYNPEYTIISKEKSIEIREYENMNIMLTSRKLPYREATYSGFRALASYIFGSNDRSEEIPMTAPVFTSMPDDETINISFVISDEYQINNQPIPLLHNLHLDLNDVNNDIPHRKNFDESNVLFHHPLHHQMKNLHDH